MLTADVVLVIILSFMLVMINNSHLRTIVTFNITYFFLQALKSFIAKKLNNLTKKTEENDKMKFKSKVDDFNVKSNFETRNLNPFKKFITENL